MILRIVLAAMALGRPPRSTRCPPSCHRLRPDLRRGLDRPGRGVDQRRGRNGRLVPRPSPLPAPPRPSGLYTGVAVVCSALAAQAFARGLVLDDCGCFGTLLRPAAALVRPRRGRPDAGVHLAAVARTATSPVRPPHRPSLHGGFDTAGEPLMRIITALRALEHATRPYDTEFAEAMERRWAELPENRQDSRPDPGPARRRLRGHPRRLPQVQPQVHALLPLPGRQPGTRRRRSHPRTGRGPDGVAARAARPARPHPAHRR